MITDRWVFDDGRLPEKVLHRHSETEQLARSLEPATRGKRAEDVLIHGPSGVGKTTTARHVLKTRLREYGAQWALINAGKTCNAILHEAIVKHPVEAAVRPNIAREKLVGTLNDIVDRPYVLILDEADTIRDLDILRDLFKISKLSVVAICHDHREWLDRLDADVREYFSLKSEIEFDRYSPTELVDILDPRAEHGLAYNVVTNDQLEWIGDEVAGVARYAIQSLLAAAEVSEENGHDRIYDRDISAGFSRARKKMRKANLRSLAFGHQFVYELLRHEGGTVSASDVHELYRQRAPSVYAASDQEPVGDRMVTLYLSKLVEYDLITQNGENRWVEYEVLDPDLEPFIDLEISSQRGELTQ